MDITNISLIVILCLSDKYTDKMYRCLKIASLPLPKLVSILAIPNEMEKYVKGKIPEVSR